MACSHNTLRRALLKGLPLFALGFVAPTAVQASNNAFGVSPKIWTKFHEWMEFRHQIDLAARKPGAVEAVLDAMDDQLIQMENYILELPAASPADSMIKALVYSSFGGFQVTNEIFDELVEVLGLSDDPRATR